MTDRRLGPLEAVAAAVTALAAGLAWAPNPALSVGILVGGVWNLISLWCLARLMNAWLGPRRSNTRVIGWLVMKFPLLYLLAIAFFRLPAASLVGFGVGFTVSLAVVITGFAVRAPRPQRVPVDGR